MTSPKEQYGGVYALTGVKNWYAVEDAAGKTLGCLVIDGHPDKEDGDVVLVSEKRQCTPEQPVTRPVGHVDFSSP
jgi:hypothetical protein